MYFYQPVNQKETSPTIAYEDGSRSFTPTDFASNHPVDLSVPPGDQSCPEKAVDKLKNNCFFTCPVFSFLGLAIIYVGVFGIVTIAKKQSKAVTGLVLQAVGKLECKAEGQNITNEQIEALNLTMGNNSFSEAFAASMISILGACSLALATKVMFNNLKSTWARFAGGLGGCAITLFGVILLADQKKNIGNTPEYKYPQTYAIPLVFLGVMMAFAAVAVRPENTPKPNGDTELDNIDLNGRPIN